MKLTGIKRKMWNVLRETALIRDGHKCQRCGAEKNLQVDHCFEEHGCASLRWELINLTTLCSSCHYLKTKKIKGVSKEIDEIVRKREGETNWQWLKKEAKKTMKWTTYLLENKMTYLEDALTKLKLKKGYFG